MPATSTLLDAAQLYAARGWRVVPLHTPLGKGACSCGRTPCPSPGKHPRSDSWPQQASQDTRVLAGWWQQWPDANIGIVTGSASRLAVLDCDPRNGGDVALDELVQQHGPLPETPLVLTGGGGTHHYFLLDAPTPSVQLAPGLDWLADGHHLVVAPPSLHSSGRHYHWEASSTPEDVALASIPGWISALAHTQAQTYTAAAAQLPAVLPTVDIACLRVADTTKALVRDGISKKYPSRSEAIAAVVGDLIRAGYEDGVIAAILTDPTLGISAKVLGQKNPKSPNYWPLTLGWVAHEIGRLRARTAILRRTRAHLTQTPGLAQNGTAGTSGAGNAIITPHTSSANTASTPSVGGASVALPLRCNKRGEPIADVANLLLILRGDPYWQGALWWDMVAETPMLRERPLCDHDYGEFFSWLAAEYGMSVGLQTLVTAVEIVCGDTPRDAIQEYLATLPAWDGFPRLEYWMGEYLAAEASEYTAVVSRMLPVAMIARAMQPGCIQRYVFVLCGAQNQGKGAIIEALGEPWYADISGSLEGKEAHLLIQGMWVAELGEMASFSRTEESRLKSYFTMRQDVYVPKFKNLTKRSPRRTIFIGTSNELEFSRDPTGNTRYLPIMVHATEIDTARFRQEKPQLLAEAVAYWHAHQQEWWRIPDALMPEVLMHQDAARRDSITEHPLQEWLTLHGYTRITASEIAEQFLRVEPARWHDRALQMSIAADMRALGWVKKLEHLPNGGTRRYYVRP